MCHFWFLVKKVSIVLILLIDFEKDDINYLSIQSTLNQETKSKLIQANARNTVSSLSSSSSASSTSSSSSSSASSIPQINYEGNQLITPVKPSSTSSSSNPSAMSNTITNNNNNAPYMLSQMSTPVKYDPKSLKLGGNY